MAGMSVPTDVRKLAVALIVGTGCSQSLQDIFDALLGDGLCKLSGEPRYACAPRLLDRLDCHGMRGQLRGPSVRQARGF